MSPDSSQYLVAFDLFEHHGRYVWSVLPFPLAFALVGLVGFLLARKSAGRRSAYLSVFFAVFGGFGITFAVVAFLGTYSDYARFQNALRRGDFIAVQGTVTGFIPGDPRGRRDEAFTVGAHRFSYSALSSSGFHQVHLRGGPVCEGRDVRITAVQGVIVRLEVSSTPCAS
jgi:hypothetical protein